MGRVDQDGGMPWMEGRGPWDEGQANACAGLPPPNKEWEIALTCEAVRCMASVDAPR